VNNKNHNLKNRNHSCPESHTIKSIFSEIDLEGIDYCILRNYENLPDCVGTHDIDMLVKPSDFRRTIAVIEHEARQTGALIIARVRSPKVMDIAILGKSEDSWWGVRLDVMAYVGTNGFPIMSTPFVLQGKQTHNGLKVANGNDASILAFLKDVIGSGKDKKGYRTAAAETYKNTENYLQVLQETFGHSLDKSQAAKIFSDEEIDLKELQKDLQGKNRKKQLLSSPFQYLSWIVKENIYKVKRIISPPGFCIAIIGTDGSGKTTVINEIKKPLESALHNNIHYEHLRPNLIPSIAVLLGKKSKDDNGPVDNPHEGKPSNFAGSLLRLSYYSIDYIFGYWFKVRKIIARRPKLFIFDRYFYDNIIDQRRNCLALPDRLVRFFGFFIPEPDMVLCLGAEPEKIFARKPELPLDEIRRQVSALKEFCDTKNNAVWIDTSSDLQTTIDDALNAISIKMSERY
jgi:thymidylate kinase